MIDKALFLVYNIIVVMSEDITGYMQTYRSGHNGADSKSVSRATGTRVRIPPSAVCEKVPGIMILFVKSMVSGTFIFVII